MKSHKAQRKRRGLSPCHHKVKVVPEQGLVQVNLWLFPPPLLLLPPLCLLVTLCETQKSCRPEVDSPHKDLFPLLLHFPVEEASPHPQPSLPSSAHLENEGLSKISSPPPSWSSLTPCSPLAFLAPFFPELLVSTVQPGPALGTGDSLVLKVQPTSHWAQHERSAGGRYKESCRARGASGGISTPEVGGIRRSPWRRSPFS